VRVKLVIVNGPVPELFSVTGGDADKLSAIFTLPNARLAVDKLTAGAVPVPVSAIPCGFPEALSVILSVAFFKPSDVGWNFGVIVQFVPAARVAGASGQVLVWLN
jgi:hypothetical protein